MDRAEIVEYLIKKAGYSRRQFAEMIGIPPTTLNSMLNRGLEKASIDNVLKVCRGLGITVEELGEMASRGLGLDEINQFVKEPSVPYKTGKLELPLYGGIAAGALSTIDPVTQRNVEYITLPKTLLGKYSDSKGLFALKVNGESMNKVIPNGSYVACKPIETINELKDDDIVIFSHDNEYSMKRFRRDEENRLLIFSPESTYRKYHDIVVSYDTVNDLKIYAKVIWYAVTLD